MKLKALIAAALVPLVALAQPANQPANQPAIIAHRGASGYLPEHTLEAYAAAYFIGADIIEPDVVLSKDGVLICTHDLALDSVTDVAGRFPGRARHDGKHYVIDFTAAELKRLRKRGRSDVHPPDGYQIATLDEMLAMIRRLNDATGRNVGVIPEPKHPAFHIAEGQPIEPPLLALLARHGYTDARDPCVVQCFDLLAIRRMREEHASRLRMAWLVGAPVTDQQLDEAAELVTAIGPRWTTLVDRTQTPWQPTAFAAACRERNLALYPWTINTEPDLRALFQTVEIAGVFTDFPDRGLAAR